MSSVCRDIARINVLHSLFYVQVPDLACRLCAEIAPQSLALAEAFGLTDDMISAPIAMDWIKYNEYDNQGEALVGHTAELTQS